VYLKANRTCETNTPVVHAPVPPGAIALNHQCSIMSTQRQTNDYQ